MRLFYLFLAAIVPVWATTNKYLNTTNSFFGDDFYAAVDNATGQASSSGSGGSDISGVQDKSVGSTIATVFSSIGNFICGFFILCDVLSTAAQVIAGVAQTVEADSKVVQNEIDQLTRHVAIRLL